MQYSPLVPVTQQFPHKALHDVVAAVRTELKRGGIGSSLAPGSKIAIGAGSRGISNYDTAVRATVDHFRELGHEPFIVPAMGSHGGGTGPGQIDVLAKYKITEVSMGCPIVSSIEVVELGRTSEGIATYLDKNAFASDGVFVVNRVKWHTTFDAPIESGIVKMCAIGLGKLQGASTYHQRAVRLGLGPVIRSVGQHVLMSGKILGGLALLEDAHHDTAEAVAVDASRMIEVEEQLLERARSYAARLLFDQVDVLIVDEVGKHISGVGMDAKIVNRHPYGGNNPWSYAPKIFRIFVRDISPLSYGNAVGIGMADVVTARLAQKIDWKATRVNAQAASNFASSRKPLECTTDAEALEALAGSVGRSDFADVTWVWIRNTLELSRILISKNLLNRSRIRMFSGLDRQSPGSSIRRVTFHRSSGC